MKNWQNWKNKKLGELLLQGQHSGLHGRQGGLGQSPRTRGKVQSRVLPPVTGVQAELVKDVLCQANFWRPYRADVGETVPQLLHGLELLVQVAHLQEGAQVGVAAVGGRPEQVERAVADALLRVQGVPPGLEAVLPLLALGHPDVQEGHAAPPLVLQEHQAVDRLVLLGAEQEEAGEALQGYVVVVVQGAGPGQALEGGVELQGGAAVDRGLALGAAVVAHLRGRCGQHGGQRPDRPEGVSDEGGATGAAAAGAAAGAEVLAAASESSPGDPSWRPEAGSGPRGRWLGVGSGMDRK